MRRCRGRGGNRVRQDVVEDGTETVLALQVNRLLNYKNEVVFLLTNVNNLLFKKFNLSVFCL